MRRYVGQMKIAGVIASARVSRVRADVSDCSHSPMIAIAWDDVLVRVVSFKYVSTIVWTMVSLISGKRSVTYVVRFVGGVAELTKL